MPSFGSPSPEQIKILLTRAEREGMNDVVIKRLTVILHFAEHHHSISDTCRHFDISRSTFHRWMERFDPEDLSKLADKSHEAQQYRCSAIDQDTVELIRRYRMRYLQMGKERIAELLLSEHGVDLSPSSIGRVIERECLYFADTPLHWKKRMEHGVHANVAAEDVPTDEPENTPAASDVHTHIAVTEEEPVSKTHASAFGWSGLKRFIIVSSVVTNIAFVGILLGMTLLEHVDATRMPDLETLQMLHAAPSQHTQP